MICPHGQPSWVSPPCSKCPEAKKKPTVNEVLHKLADCESAHDVQKVFDMLDDGLFSASTTKMRMLAGWCGTEAIVRDALRRLTTTIYPRYNHEDTRR